MLRVTNLLHGAGLRAGIVEARGVTPAPSPPAFQEELAALAAERARGDWPPPDRVKAVRGLLRAGGFKPSGRNKPASEYLAQAAREGRFPFIGNLVDCNNYVSLASGLPASLLDLAVTGDAIVLRLGAPGERYVFNAAGQEIDLAGLICIATAAGVPLGNPVKDSVAGKVKEHTRAVAGVVFAPSQHLSKEELQGHLDLFCDLLRRHGGAQSTETQMA